MKMILIAAAALMTGASVYGVIDYNKRSGNRDFENLYKKDKPAQVDEPSATMPPGREKEVKPEAVDEKAKVVVSEEKSVKKLPGKKRKLSYKEFSRAEPAEVIVEKDAH